MPVIRQKAEKESVLQDSSSATSVLDIKGNRFARKWTAKEMIGRTLWEAFGRILFAWSPRPMWSWRRIILKLFGAQVGREVHIHPSVKIAIPWTLKLEDQCAVGDGAVLYGLGSIHIGARATVSQYAHLCAGTHDHQSADMLLIKAHISIGDDAWICADAFVGPNVCVGKGAILGARGVAMKDLTADTIHAGNPAREIGPRVRAPEGTTRQAS